MFLNLSTLLTLMHFLCNLFQTENVCFLAANLEWRFTKARLCPLVLLSFLTLKNTSLYALKFIYILFSRVTPPILRQYSKFGLTKDLYSSIINSLFPYVIFLLIKPSICFSWLQYHIVPSLLYPNLGTMTATSFSLAVGSSTVLSFRFSLPNMSTLAFDTVK